MFNIILLSTAIYRECILFTRLFISYKWYRVDRKDGCMYHLTINMFANPLVHCRHLADLYFGDMPQWLINIGVILACLCEWAYHSVHNLLTSSNMIFKNTGLHQPHGSIERWASAMKCFKWISSWNWCFTVHVQMQFYFLIYFEPIARF